jgi:hypothetical protein
MLDGRAVELDACRDLGISIFAGEAEGRLEAVLQDAAAGRLAPVYNFMNDLPGMEGTVVPFLPKRYVTRTLGLSTSFDAGRGCPYQCSFCTIINVQGRKSRHRSDSSLPIGEQIQGLANKFPTPRNREDVTLAAGLPHRDAVDCCRAGFDLGEPLLSARNRGGELRASVGADRKDLCSRRGFGSNDVAMASMGRLAPRHGEDEQVVLFVLRGMIFAQQRDGDLGPSHLDLPNIGGDQLGVVDGRIVADVPTERIDNNSLDLAAGTRATDPAASGRPWIGADDT